MILVFIFLGIIIFVLFTIFILMLSTLKIEVNKLHITNINVNFEVEFLASIAIYFLNKFKVLKLTIDEDKIKDGIKSGKIDVNKIKNNNQFNKDSLKILKKLKVNIEYFKLEGEFSTFNTVLSSWIYGIINAIIPILIGSKINGRYINNIRMLNINENQININFNCIISVKIVNIINILHYLKKKGGVENNGKSSNRRDYAYSNE